MQVKDGDYAILASVAAHVASIVFRTATDGRPTV